MQCEGENPTTVITVIMVVPFFMPHLAFSFVLLYYYNLFATIKLIYCYIIAIDMNC